MHERPPERKQASDDFLSWHRFLIVLKKANISLSEPFQTLVFSLVLLYSGVCGHMKCACLFQSCFHLVKLTLKFFNVLSAFRIFMRECDADGIILDCNI